MYSPLPARALHQQLHQTLAAGRSVFQLPPGRHIILGDELPTRPCYISNHDHGPRPILFDVDGACDVVLDGQGATLDCLGNVLPIRIGRSRRVIIRNLVLDWIRPFFTQAEVVQTSPGALEFIYDPVRYPLDVEGDRLVACAPPHWRTDRLWNLLPFDRTRQEVSRRQENWHLSQAHRAHRLAPDRIRLEAAFPEGYAPGTPVVLMHGNRVAPGIWIEDAQDVVVENVTIHHAPGMGVIAQRSRDITLDGLRVIPSGSRLFSTWVDGAHLVDCGGTICLRNSEVRGQFDDAVNLHARFTRVGHRPGRYSARIHTVHPQHAGPNPATPGVGWAFYRRSTLELVQVNRVLAARDLDPHTAEITLADPLPDLPDELVGARYEPEGRVDIQNCRFGANRGRGVLINQEHQVTIHHNHFHVSGRGVESIPDANYWWEGGPVRDLAIHHNTFEDCGFGPCGDDQIYLGPELPDGADPRGQPLRTTEQKAAPCILPVLRNIRIHHNLFIRHRGRLLHAHGVDGLVFRDNRIQDSTRYPVTPAANLVDLGESVRNVTIEITPPPG